MARSLMSSSPGHLLPTDRQLLTMPCRPCFVCPDSAKDQGAAIEGQRYANGTQRRCAPYADVPVLRPDGTQAVDPITGVGLTKAVIPDRVVRNFSDGILGQSGRYIVDTCVPAPEVASHVRAAAKTPLAAANKAYAGKYAAYAPHLQQHDALLAVVAETWGGLHPACLLYTSDAADE